MAARKRSAVRKTAGIKGKRITVKQKIARRKNIAIARSYKKKGVKKPTTAFRSAGKMSKYTQGRFKSVLESAMTPNVSSHGIKVGRKISRSYIKSMKSGSFISIEGRSSSRLKRMLKTSGIGYKSGTYKGEKGIRIGRARSQWKTGKRYYD